MFRFENDIYLYFLFSVPVLFLVYYFLRLSRKKVLAKYGDSKLIVTLMPDYSKYKPWVRFALVMSALISLIFTIANPQIGSKLSEMKREGIDIIIALDISNSMMAEDIQPSRLERAKQTISNLIDKMKSDRIGLIVFAGDAFVQLPLTTDYAAAKLFLSIIEPDIISVQGTAIGKAIDIALTRFKTDDKVKKAIIVLSDGENHEDDAIAQASKAAEEGFTVYTVGMGTNAGAPVPEYSNGRNIGFLKDNTGSVVTSRLSADMLRKIASAGGGDFIMAGNSGSDMEGLIDKLAGLDKTEFSSKLYTDYDDKFQYAAILSLFFLLVEFFLSDKVNRFIKRLNRFVETRSLVSK